MNCATRILIYFEPWDSPPFQKARPTLFHIRRAVGVLVRGYSSREARLATNFKIVPRLGANGVINLLPHTPSWCAKDNTTPAFHWISSVQHHAVGYLPVPYCLQWCFRFTVAYRPLPPGKSSTTVQISSEPLQELYIVNFKISVKFSIFNLALNFRHRASCILGQAFRYSSENAFYIFNQQIYFIIWYLLDRASLI